MLPNIICDCSCIQKFSMVASINNVFWVAEISNIFIIKAHVCCYYFLVRLLIIWPFSKFMFYFWFPKWLPLHWRSKTFNIRPWGIRKKKFCPRRYTCITIFSGLFVFEDLSVWTISHCGLTLVMGMAHLNSPLNSPLHEIYINHWFLIYLY